MSGTSDDERAAARKRLEERRGFVPHLLMYLVVNGVLIFVWASSDPHGFFWPAIVLLVWGVGVIMHGWNAFLAKPITEAAVDRELKRDSADSGSPGGPGDSEQHHVS